ncbi:PREDICTED: unconventional prefoldin RPB5 interactor [Dinoponera quadriceps]|uniref:Unconventional prefoldin RPB5 interactor n=1 Tax=Dinoponera quadriceps TaxID=609295 RepID=A0A6P3XLP9_DINQU|nr:PREDICTED: unconventional prefoldin RPB5 interactor [Dinoponera quadriceps]
MDNTVTIAASMKSEQIQKQQMLNNWLRERLELNQKELNTWIDKKKQLEKVIEGLREFPLSVSEKCMVPISKLAFMKGKLIHTNEILACLGDGYFAKYSASQAIALCNRRISYIDETLRRLENERMLYDARLLLSAEHDVFGEQDKKDIFEHLDEDELAEWRIQHRQHEKEYRQKLSELKEKEKTNTCTEEELFKRLDELELEEELEDEMNRLEAERQEFYADDLEEGEVYDESEEDDESDSDPITVEMLQEELKRLKDIQANKVTNDTSNISNSCDATQDETLSTNSTESIQPDVNSTEEALKESSSTESEYTSKSTDGTDTTRRKKKVSFVELNDQSNAGDKPSILEVKQDYSVEQDDTHNEDNDDDIRIEFLHSTHVPNIPEPNNTEIQSPADIYKIFSVPIKPILKRSPNDMFSNQAVPPLREDSSTDTEDESSGVKPSAYDFVIKNIQEKKVTTSFDNTVEKKNIRPVSRFKMERVRSAK